MITSVLTHKGGVAKTTTVVNLAAAFAELGQTSLLIDLDYPQCTLGEFRRAIPKCAYAVAQHPTELQALLEADHGRDHVIIDCPPRVGAHDPTGVIALLHSDIALVPIQTLPAALQASYSVSELIDKVKPRNERLQMVVLLTMFRSWDICRRQRDQARIDYEGRILSAVIPEREDIANAGEVRKSILKYAPDSKGAKEYRKAAKELLKTWQTETP